MEVLSSMEAAMSTKTKKKLCWNCEGEVLMNAVQCPFCGVSLEVMAMQEKAKDALTPPYKLVNTPADGKVPASPYSKATSPKKEAAPVNETEESVFNEHAHGDPKSIVLSLAFMLSGAAFAIFGIILWLFADHNGHLTLRWNAHYWYVYILLSLPLLYLGCKATQRARKSDDQDEE